MNAEESNAVVYKPTAFWLFLIVGGCIAGGAMFAIMPAAWIVNDPQWSPVQVSMLAIGIGLLGFSVWGAPKFARYRIKTYPDRFHYKGAFSSTELRLDEIAGYRILPTQYIATLQLEPRRPKARKLRIALVYERQAELRAWLNASLVNLDDRDRAETLESILSDEHLGSTKEERVRRLTDARKWTRTLNFLGFVAIGWGVFYPHPYGYAVGLLLALPPLALLMLSLSRGAIRYDAPAASGHPTVALPFMMPPVALFLRALLDWHLVDWFELLPATVVLGAVLTITLWISAADIRRRTMMLVMGAGISLLYAFGAAAFINGFRDRSDPVIHEATVIGRRVSESKQTSYHLNITPFVNEISHREIQVSAAIYDRHPVGTAVHIHLKEGRLGAAWFYIR